MPGCIASELEGEITSVKYAGTDGSTWDFFTFLCVWYYNNITLIPVKDSDL